MLTGPRQRWIGQKRGLHIVRELVEGRRHFNQVPAGSRGQSPDARQATGRPGGRRDHPAPRRLPSPAWLEYELTVKGRTLNKVVEALARGGTGGWRGPASGPRGRAPPDPCVLPPTLFSHGSRISRASATSSAGELSYWDCGRRPRQFDSRLQRVRPDPRGMSEFRLGPRQRRHGIAIRSGGTQSCVMKRWVSSLHYS